MLGKIARSEELPGEDLYQELLAEDRAREEAGRRGCRQGCRRSGCGGVLDEDAEVAKAETGTVEE